MPGKDFWNFWQQPITNQQDGYSQPHAHAQNILEVSCSWYYYENKRRKWYTVRWDKWKSEGETIWDAWHKCKYWIKGSHITKWISTALVVISNIACEWLDSLCNSSCLCSELKLPASKCCHSSRKFLAMKLITQSPFSKMKPFTPKWNDGISNKYVLTLFHKDIIADSFAASVFPLHHSIKKCAIEML